ncbi:hydantoinase/oxoprolinase family protein [Geobacillus sp. BMUD]|uniref:hydantoinase/oxoprolinase family protein n=1 Tax=Geobacillus sp. BMUD TaxID=2508876 RepID=UPI0014911D5D|nr:hydantoinase/oxoprolinase family protein [Geobacillus sp. BMUD]NNU83798.1 hydantoinase/oxoprolinase family protein [Geobacillus sp. BMUD]
MYRLGIDVGETNTDAVLLDSYSRIVQTVKKPTSPDIGSGLYTVLEEIIERNQTDPKDIAAVMIGTTYCLQALKKKENLSGVCVIRIGNGKNAVPPLFEGNNSLRRCVMSDYLEIDGGHEVTGRPLGVMDYSQIERFFFHWLGKEPIEAVVITGTFSPMNPEHETMAASHVRSIVGADIPITLSHEIGSIGFIERENASIINALLSKPMDRALHRLQSVLQHFGINGDIYFTQNDGSLMSYEHALRYPIRTLWSGITNSLLGSSFLTGLKNSIVVDVDGSSVHVALLENGFPKEKRRSQLIDGVRVNVPMPDIVSLPFEPEQLNRDEFLERLYQVIQRFQPRYEPLPVIFVGDGGQQLAERFHYPWADIIVPDYHQYVNAIGACIAPVSGYIDRMVWVDPFNQNQALYSAINEAKHRAISAGANPKTVIVQEAKAIPLAYVPSKALRVRVKVIGTLSFSSKGGM